MGDSLIQGLTEVAHTRPSDPVQFLAEYLHTIADKRKQVILPAKMCMRRTFRSTSFAPSRKQPADAAIVNKVNPEVQVVQVKPITDNTERKTTAEERAHIDKVDKVFVVPDTSLIGMDQSDFKNSASESAATSDERVSAHYLATILSDIAVITRFHPLPHSLPIG